jgi:membrane protease YdiL (CAAX protease family)
MYAQGKEEPFDFIYQQLEQLATVSRGTASQSDDGSSAQPPTATAADSEALAPEIALALVYGMLAAQLASGCLIWRVVPRIVGKDWRQHLGWRPLRWRQVGLLALALLPLMVAAGGIQELIQSLTGQDTTINERHSIRDIFARAPLWIALAAVALGPGIVEELWCRGFVGQGLVRRYGVIFGVLWTSLLFGFMHIDPVHALVAAAMGVYLHFVYFACRSILAPIMLHVLNNALVVLVDLYRKGPAQVATDAPALPLTWYIIAAVILAIISYLLWRTRPSESVHSNSNVNPPNKSSEQGLGFNDSSFGPISEANINSPH